MVHRTVYLHGLPGSPAELLLGGERSRWLDPTRVLAPNRSGLDGTRAVVISRLASQIERWAEGALVNLVGFSLGGAIALDLALVLQDQVQRIDLVAPAAPLSLGSFLDAMAGGPLFRMAKDHPRGFAVAALLQGWAARWAPGLMVKALLADVRGEDRSLTASPTFRKMLRTVLKDTFERGSAPYRDEVRHFVMDCGAGLEQVTQPVFIWQGDQDNWVPLAMAEALTSALPAGASLTLLPGLSHYSALAWFLNQFSPDGSRR